jgi:endonuclease/exonuclease/phosphatase family metal-dependent hydrolase
MQDPTPDADDATSEGIFVFTASAPTVAVGDAVEVDGRVMEFRPGGSTSTNLTTTEITSPSVIVTSSGTPLPSPTVVGNGGRIPPDTVIEDDASGSVETSGVFDSAADGIDFYESLEGMRVQLNDALAVGPTNEFGEIPVVGDGGANAGIRTARGGVVIRPADFNPERITLDDSILGTPTLDVGDRLGGAVVGVMDYSFGNFKLNITEPPTAVRGGLAREISAGAGPKEIAVATFNVENLDPSDGPAKFDRLADLIVTNLKSPDLLALEEVQDNNGPVNDTTTDADLTLAMLVGAIQSAGGPTYEWRQINPVDDQDGGEPGGNIRVAFLFRSDRGVEFRDRPGGDSTTATQVASTPSGPELTFSPGRIDPTNPAWNGSRKPLAAEFKIRNRKFFVIANHFNSKGGDQPLFGRFQPPTRSSEVQRHQQAQVVNDFVDQILAVDPNANVVALGDFNDFEFSSALRTLEGDVLNDLIETLPQEERYSFVFEGNSQTLDHILASDHLRDDVPFAFDVVHVNSEFADQASDHDPSVVRFALNNPPRPHAAGPYTVGEGGAVTVAASADDPEGDPVTYAWDLDGDGTFETPGQAATFSAAGLDGPTSRAIAVRATDDGGLSGVDSVAVAITNVGPTVRSAFTPFAVACGTDNGALEASVADPGPDTFSASVDWGDGSPAEALGAVGSSFAPLHTYAAAGLYEATLTVTDDDGGTGSFAASVRVNYAVTVLRPLGDRSRDILQAASTIPVKIAVADCDGSRPANLRPRIRVVKTSGSPPNLEINEPLSTSAADTTGIMRFEGSQYVYNLAGKALPDPTATYRIAMTLPNGQVVTASFGLRT